MSFSHSPKIVTSGLVLALDAADQNSYVSGSTIWNDMSGNGNTGTLTNGPTFNSTNGGSIVFDGVNDYINLQKPSSLNFGTSSFTVSIWFYTATGNVAALLADKGLTNNTNSSGWYVLLDNRYNSITNGLGFAVSSTSLNTSYAAISSTTSYVVGQWNNVTGVWDSTGKNAYIYLNSVLLGTTVTQTGGSGLVGVTNTDNASFDTILAAYNNGISNFFAGNISNTLIYNRALSTTEIQQNYNTQKSRFGL
jgi:hypothetical protein